MRCSASKQAVHGWRLMAWPWDRAPFRVTSLLVSAVGVQYVVVARAVEQVDGGVARAGRQKVVPVDVRAQGGGVAGRAHRASAAIQVDDAQRDVQRVCERHDLDVVALLIHGVHESPAKGGDVQVGQALECG